jgi:hypothetical protein
MVEPVGEHRVVTADQRWDDSQIGHVAGREQQGAGKSRKRGELLFERGVRGEVATDQMRGAAADTPGAGAGAGGFDHGRVVGQAQVVIAAEADQILASNPCLRAAGKFKRTAAALESLALQCVEFALQFFPDHGCRAASSAAVARATRNAHCSGLMTYGGMK